MREALEETGDPAYVFEAVMYSAMLRSVLPEWVRIELRRIYNDLGSGELRDLNEAFGWDNPVHRNRRTADAAFGQKKAAIFIALCEARRKGVPMVKETFEEIGVRLHVGRPMVEKVWESRKKELQAISKGDPPVNVGAGLIDLWGP